MVRSRSSTRLGVGFGLAAACSFGASAPFAQRLVTRVDPQLLAGLLYLGAALVLTFAGSGRRRREARVGRADVPTLLIVVAVGGVIAPVLLLVGLQHVSGVAGSLALNLEAPLTALLAVWVFGEYLGRRTWIGGLIIVLGAVVLGAGSGGSETGALGIVLIALACGAWALDNNLTQRLTVRDPVTIVRIKAGGAAATNLVVASARGAGFPVLPLLLAALALGAVSYGVSVLLDAYALRLLGSAREAALFATAPFAGVVVAVVLLGEPLVWETGLALIAMAAGTTLLLTDRHEHTHRHAALTHEHRHAHDEHHQHAHAPGIDPREPHSHPHEHASLVHSHEHASDIHHRHRHRTGQEEPG